jgi:hypothetical protein
MATAYHQPGDDLRLPWKPETAPDFDDFMAELVLRVANREAAQSSR